MRDCPECGCTLKHIGSVGIIVLGDDQSDNDAQADRWDCPEGHTFLIVDTERMPECSPSDN